MLIPSYDVLPARDRWAVSRDGSNRATISTWSGGMQWRTVYDERGTGHQVAVLTGVSGLNPADRVDRSGTVIEARPMPPTFYLKDHERGGLLTSFPTGSGGVRVQGEVHIHVRGGVVYDGEQPKRVYASDPTTLPTFEQGPTTGPSEGRRAHADALRRLHQEIWPVILVEKITPMDGNGT
jgi:hypothetical protein